MVTDQFQHHGPTWVRILTRWVTFCPSIRIPLLVGHNVWYENLCSQRSVVSSRDQSQPKSILSHTEQLETDYTLLWPLPLQAESPHRGG